MQGPAFLICIFLFNFEKFFNFFMHCSDVNDGTVGLSEGLMTDWTLGIFFYEASQSGLVMLERIVAT